MTDYSQNLSEIDYSYG